jgi:hypothetical protein
MANKKPLPPDPLVDYSDQGVPISRKLEDEAVPNREAPLRSPKESDAAGESGNPPDSGFTGGAHNKKRQGTEDAQKRSDTGTGL